MRPYPLARPCTPQDKVHEALQPVLPGPCSCPESCTQRHSRLLGGGQPRVHWRCGYMRAPQAHLQ